MIRRGSLKIITAVKYIYYLFLNELTVMCAITKITVSFCVLKSIHVINNTTYG